MFNADSTATYEDYVNRCKELGHKVISSVEHGWQSNYYVPFGLVQENNKKYKKLYTEHQISKDEYEKNLLKFVFGTEAYWVKKRGVVRIEKYIDKKGKSQTKEIKDKSNCHMVILAKNENGRRAINDILTEASISGYYYRPRIDLDLIMSLPKDDVFITSACVAGWKYEDAEQIFIQLHNYFGNNFMLEIQNHNTQAQIELNQKILRISQENNIQMIVGLDSHYIYPEQSADRDYLLEAKNVHYPEEVGWYMDYPDDETVINRFLEQGVFNKEQIQQAMDNTDICLSFDDYDDNIIFQKKIKLPSLYPNKTQEEKNDIYGRLITKKFKEYMKGVPKSEQQKYFEGVQMEVNTYKNTGMVDYPLIDYQIMKRYKEKGGVLTKTGRGSAPSYFTNTLCGFSSIDRFNSPIKLYPERFISESRIKETKSLPDIDMNVSDQGLCAEAQEEIMGHNHSYPMISFGTLKKKAAFKLYARAKKMDFDLANKISEQLGEYDEAYKYASDEEKEDMTIYDFVDKQYHEYLDKSKPYLGIVVDKKKAPCSYLLYAGDIRREIGLIKCKSESTHKEYITTVIDGAVAENYKFLKNDLLKVDVVLLIDKICKRIGIKQPTVPELTKIIDGNKRVWDIYANGYTMGINQCEKDSATKKLMFYKPKNISELSAWVAAIRPGFRSMYSTFASRKPFEYGIPAFDKLLKTEQLPYSFMFYQEQTMNTLNYAGFPMEQCYGIIKAIAKKHPEKVLPLKAVFINGKRNDKECPIEGFKNRIMKDDNIPLEKATDDANKVWKIIEDSSKYSFNASHSISVAYDSLYGAWLKAYYPYEFYEVMLQHYSDKGNKDKVTLFKQEMKRAFGISEGRYKWGNDNRKFTADKKNHTINPSILSIKSLNQKVANELYALSQQTHYNSFMNLLQDIHTKTSVSSDQLEILIKIDYFSDFGDINSILEQVKIY
ncbi:MAG: PHP domain-containing protein, partial [Lachnospiraceae bacterium]|nr:PHP domain-containing protein [Lachnospiraceae bacterium]